MNNFYQNAVTLDNMSLLCYTNAALIKGEIKGVATYFHGFGYGSMKGEPERYDEYLAENGILTMFPFYDPWAWGNKSAMDLCDRLIDLVYEKHGLSDDVPLVITGESMGGLTALAYNVYSKRRAVACAANCPVADLAKMNERRDILRGLGAAYASEYDTLEEAIAAVSPVELVDKMPDIPYYVIQGGRDDELNDSVRAGALLIPKMQKRGLDVKYVFVPDMVHCHMPMHDYDAYYEFVKEQVEKNVK